MLLVLLAAPASALTFDAVATTPLVSPAQDVALYAVGVDHAAYVPLADGTWAVWGSAAADTAVPAGPGTAAAGTDAALLYCSDGQLVAWDGAADTPAGAPCVDVAARDDRALVRDGAQLVLYGGTLPNGPVAADAALFDLAPESESGTPVAWAALGETSLHQLDRFGESSFALGEPLTALGWGGTDWLIGGASGFRLLGGDTLALPAAPIQLGAADFDADGAAELWAFDGTTLSVVSGGATVQVALTADVVAVGDVNGDGCADVIGAAGAELHTVSALDCPAYLDPDGDGMSAAAGDCEPDDGTIYPGAAEACDGVDQDCDGVADDPGLLTLVSAGGVEGSVFSFTATVDGCDGATGIWDWSFLGEAQCSADGATANCLALDDTTVTASVRLQPAEGAALEATAEATVANVAPYLYDDGVDWGDHPEGLVNRLDLSEGESWSAQLVSSDPGTDTVSWSLTGNGLPVSITEDGVLSVQADAALTGTFVVTITDDDGGASDHTFALTVRAPDDTDDATDASSGLCCAGASASGLALSAWALLLRRRRA